MLVASSGTSNVTSAPTSSPRSSTNAAMSRNRPQQMVIMVVLALVCLFVFTTGLV